MPKPHDQHGLATARTVRGWETRVRAGVVLPWQVYASIAGQPTHNAALPAGQRRLTVQLQTVCIPCCHSMRQCRLPPLPNYMLCWHAASRVHCLVGSAHNGGLAGHTCRQNATASRGSWNTCSRAAGRVRILYFNERANFLLSQNDCSLSSRYSIAKWRVGITVMSDNVPQTMWPMCARANMYFDVRCAKQPCLRRHSCDDAMMQCRPLSKY